MVFCYDEYVNVKDFFDKINCVFIVVKKDNDFIYYDWVLDFKDLDFIGKVIFVKFILVNVFIS